MDTNEASGLLARLALLASFSNWEAPTSHGGTSVSWARCSGWRCRWEDEPKE
jgi:hypothetical protein